ncbi:HD domain-containing phosphohydrolase [uncultured Treponema sp.]|uniref:HD domain-containing phosphohydrolase n=1 Tax=uncultured Treponema sp. TaxID=162155 RepID=UPI0025E49BE3|nr:HD domain-containing phosphohydrolase [uncultured Treponema sp.]
MYDFIYDNQLNMMLFLCAISTTMALMLFITQFLPKKRKYILIGMEVIATILLGFDRLAYIYSGDMTPFGYIMTRLSNFVVFFMTSGIVFCFNLYVADLIGSRATTGWISKRLRFVTIASSIGMLLSILTVFTGLYYSFDAQNVYHRGRFFLIAYIIPVICPIVQFTVIHKYKKLFSHFIYIALCLYIFVPIIVGIIQIFTYGLSIVNMAMILVSVSLYIFTYLDINDEVQKAHNMEMEILQKEQKSMKSLFSQTAIAFSEALEKRSDLLKGNSQRTAQVALKIAKKCGKSDEICREAYNTALFHNAGICTIPDSLLCREENLTEAEEKLIKNLPQEGAEILSNIEAVPYLSQNLRHLHERYDGKGLPERLKGEEIPEAARIVAVAEEYVAVTSRNKSRNPVPKALVREEFVKEAGLRFDPNFSMAMVHLMDIESNEQTDNYTEFLESELSCREYREHVSSGFEVLKNFTEVSFNFASTAQENEFSAPSIIIYDSFDRKVHKTQKSIDTYHYLEYGEVWFDGHTISTSARNIESKVSEKETPDSEDSAYTLSVARYGDHLLLKTESPTKKAQVIVALPDVSKSAYIALSAENGQLSDIKITHKDEKLNEESIPRIAEQISYINHIESDLPNLQINGPRSSYTEGVKIEDRMKLSFHTMSLPEANLVWHCPYIVIYHSKDGKIDGEDYREYAFIKLNGEDNGSNEFAVNTFQMKRNESFVSWNKWKEENKKGLECRIDFSKKGNTITLSTENLGISIKNTCKIFENKEDIYAALTGDQCAITDIRIL